METERERERVASKQPLPNAENRIEEYCGGCDSWSIENQSNRKCICSFWWVVFWFMAASRHVHPYGAMSAVWMYLVCRGKRGEERRKARTVTPEEESGVQWARFVWRTVACYDTLAFIKRLILAIFLKTFLKLKILANSNYCGVVY